jgi:Domain of unknown function (DUF4150)
MSLPPPSDNYIGEPQYPAPWATKKPREGLRDNDAARIVSLAPDVCRAPGCPVPFPVVDFCGHDENYTPSVNFTSQRVMTMKSNTTHVHGDEPGVGKGVKSGTVGARCHPIGNADQVRAEGCNVIRHLDRFHMNDRNTVGEACFVRDTKAYAAPVDDDKVPGSLRRTMTDWEEPVILGAQYAQAQPKPAPSPLPQSPSPKPVFDPNKLPPAANDNFERKGPYGKPVKPGAANRVLGLLGLGAAGYQLGDMAGQWYVGPDGVMGRAIGDHLRGQVSPFSPQGSFIGDLPLRFGAEGHIANANDLLSLKSGYPVDFREMDPEDLEDLLKKPWPSAEEMKARKDGKKEDPKPAPLPQTDDVRVDKDKEFPCLVGSYDTISKVCPGEAHHIVPDMALRYGNRAEGIKGTNRIPNAPSFGQGMTVCLTGSMHGGLHGSLNATLASIGSTQTPAGTAPMLKILKASTDSIDSIKGLSQECKEKAKAAARTQMLPIAAQPGRTTLPLPSTLGDPSPRTVLERGYY